MNKMKKQNGITLVALVITIIVMMILVGVSVTVALNGGLFSTAQQAVATTEAERDNELALSDGKVEINGKVYNSINEYVHGSVEYTEYLIGQEVTVDGENFYVIADSDKTQEKVTLLAKYCLNQAGTEQSNATYSETTCAFSSTDYWSSATEFPIDLNTYEVPEGVDSIVTTAKAYGEAKGGIGRLLTKEEAESLITNYAGLVYGTNVDATDGYLRYWLSNIERDEGGYEAIYNVWGDNPYITLDPYDHVELVRLTSSYRNIKIINFIVLIKKLIYKILSIWNVAVRKNPFSEK